MCHLDSATSLGVSLIKAAMRRGAIDKNNQQQVHRNLTASRKADGFAKRMSRGCSCYMQNKAALTSEISW
ncbi:MAG: hypothetical protein COA78_08730 [Blastopirellula sp.]|nr:MAG: hypothetical protein COA78_08730 [Blastopirellula sp.]